ncbi:uncharacterized protein BKA55DRAFT_697049 [Fusarium redolens]|uniref:Uncharacterized protein n=1 Tax=Fusarium redolens TaxID=48865 RepID=A0A9P9FZY5_FUSRE|nr:uncharacterized protein BKA55DRAFT_697049 [Fusarium redolens]KAH7227193.1 hypothetical protein BKA55DRAFT_697049 [Fusarium redolens]
MAVKSNSTDLVDEKIKDRQYIDTVHNQPDHSYISPEDIQGRSPLLRGLSKEQIDTLNKRVLRKIVWRLLPIVNLMYLMNYLDRMYVSNARLSGFQSDLNMSDTTWNAGISTFYIGYSLFIRTF